MLVFVYGTLKRGFPNHEFMKGIFHSQAMTLCSFPLIIGTPMAVPFLLPFPDQGKRVKGELYTVNAKQLEYLDEFEAVQQGLYFRDSIQVEQLFDEPKQQTVVLQSWAYFRGEAGPSWASDFSSDKLLDNEHLEEYTLDKVKYFVPRNQR
ncbi:Putative gamma-glutamylcyclotransferase [Galdieria sulphuraria]|nr:Putative gamma-glutamylcyclotransferase [Galdieria sulphuraria]